MDTVLCVDDEKSVLNSLRRLFLDEPWKLLFATNGAEGLERMAECDVDLVLADFRMPGMDGVEFLKRVRAAHPDCMRVVLSGYADIRLIVSALNEGQIYKFIAKPWNGDELKDTIRKLLRHRQVDRENRLLGEKLRELNAELSTRIDALQAQVREARQQVRVVEKALEAAPLPMIALDAGGAVLFANRRARETMPAGPAVDRPIPGLSPDAWEEVLSLAREAPDACAARTLALAGETAVLAVTSVRVRSSAPAR